MCTFLRIVMIRGLLFSFILNSHDTIILHANMVNAFTFHSHFAKRISMTEKCSLKIMPKKFLLWSNFFARNWYVRDTVLDKILRKIFLHWHIIVYGIFFHTVIIEVGQEFKAFDFAIFWWPRDKIQFQKGLQFANSAWASLKTANGISASSVL